jgi:1-aminocyclopropane-1-carboxylate deaminase/D-cysteine desulfhydrase-like pyridoxal-dependent ACC family enzyme
VKRLAIETASLLRKRGARDIQANLPDVEVADEWLGGGYGRATREGEEARKLVADSVGLRLDPTYTGKTMAALLAMCRRRELRGPVLYWHTYDAIMPKDERPGPQDYLRLPEEFRQFCPAS